MKVLVCGGRDYEDRRRVFSELNQLCRKLSPFKPVDPRWITIIHGGCPTGADRWANEWADRYAGVYKAFRADWAKHGPAAGPIRNQRMLDEGKPDLVLAFPGGRGTADMVRRAKAAGVEVIEIKREDIA